MKKLLYLAVAFSLAQNSSAQTLIAHWDFSGGSTTDLVNGWTPGPLSTGGSPTAVAGRAGVANTAVSFNGAQNLVFPHDPKMDLTSWTITAVVRPKAFYKGLCQGNVIVGHDDNYTSQFYSLGYFDNQVDGDCYNYYPDSTVFYLGAAGYPTFPYKDWGGNIAPGSNPKIVLNNWYCVTAMYDGTTGYMDLYVNGNLAISEHGAPYSWPNHYSYGSYTSDLYIGSQYNPKGSWPYWLNADVDDIKIYNGVFTNIQDITALCGTRDDGGNNNNDSSTGIAKSNVIPKMTISPNPAVNNAIIRIPANDGNVKLILTNTMGTVIKQYMADRSGITNIDLSAIPDGIYIVTADMNGTIIRQKMIKQ